jgi:hypothetical protein
MIKLKTLLLEQNEDPVQIHPHVTVTTDPKTKQTTVDVEQSAWPYADPESEQIKKFNWYERPGIDTSGLGFKINKFAKRFTEAFSEKFNSYVQPLITSGYRGPERQINAIWPNWVNNNDYLDDVNYLEPFKTTIFNLFNRTNLEETDPQYLTPDQAKSEAVKYLKKQENQNKYMSNHQTRGAIDIAVFAGGLYDEKNNWLNEWLASEQAAGRLKYLDERDQKNAHFHIRFRGNE